MKKVLQNWTITSGLQSVSLPCNSNLMLPPYFYTDLSKGIFLAIGKYHSMYRKHICFKHLSKSQEAILIALDWGFVSPNVALKESQPDILQNQLIPLELGGTSCPFAFPASHHWLQWAAISTLSLQGLDFLKILYSEPANRSFHLAHFLLCFSSYLFPFFPPSL